MPVTRLEEGDGQIGVMEWCALELPRHGEGIATTNERILGVALRSSMVKVGRTGVGLDRSSGLVVLLGGSTTGRGRKDETLLGRR